MLVVPKNRKQKKSKVAFSKSTKAATLSANLLASPKGQQTALLHAV